MKHWWFIWRLALYRPGLWLLSGLLASGLFYVFPLLPGLVIQPFLDGLSGSAPMTLDTWGMVALLVGMAAGRVIAGFGAVTAENTAQLTAAALLRRNLLVYGLGGLVAPFIGIKLIDMALAALGLA